MNIFIIVSCSILLFLVIRCIVLIVSGLVDKIFKSQPEDSKFQLGVSIILFLLYLYIFCEVVQKAIGLIESVSILDWFIIYTCMGVSAIIWCYFSWELRWTAKPNFGKDEKGIVIKKIVVFVIVLIVSFYQGYNQLNKYFNANYDETTSILVTITNSTIIPGIIAMDRVLNQIKNYLQIKKKNEE